MTSAPDLSAFGATPLHPLSGGHRNAVWRADLAGRPMVAKSTRRSDAALRWLFPLQAAARQVGFIVPHLIETPSGPAPNGWTLEALVEGHAATAPALAALAPRISAFHATTGDLPQRPGFASCRELPQVLRGGDIDLTQLPNEVGEICASAWRGLAGTDCAIHGDLCAANIILGPDGPALIDWDEARKDLPFFDLVATSPMSADQKRAHLAWEVASCWQAEPTRARALLLELRASE
ncbi:phosphotransferase [Gemmobacter denitrificans]|uniref:Phosphotransferase n=1 Tax=Gemmobacter denitrificans TaxID=3123040 RepID=A0ABU8BP92_9RHOB